MALHFQYSRGIFKHITSLPPLKSICAFPLNIEWNSYSYYQTYRALLDPPPPTSPILSYVSLWISLLLLLLSHFSCVWLCDPTDSSPPGSSVPGILQARTLEWVAISFSNASKWKVKVKLLSRVQLLATPWTAAYQVLPSMGFSRQEYWSGLPLSSLDFSPTTWNSHWLAINEQLWMNGWMDG